MGVRIALARIARRKHRRYRSGSIAIDRLVEIDLSSRHAWLM
jgi:hypothetical protein